MTREEKMDWLYRLRSNIYVYMPKEWLIPVNDALDAAIKALDQEPRKGHWEHGRELSRVFIGDALRGINYEDWHCSNCHCVVEEPIKPKWNFCPNCGAEMEEVKE
jgi:hypothetical protein